MQSQKDEKVWAETKQFVKRKVWPWAKTNRKQIKRERKKKPKNEMELL